MGIICMSPYSTCELPWSSSVISAEIFESCSMARLTVIGPSTFAVVTT